MEGTTAALGSRSTLAIGDLSVRHRDLRPHKLRFSATGRRIAVRGVRWFSPPYQ